MPFYDKSAYSSHLRAQNSAPSTIILALAFIQDQSHIAAATTTGRISLHSLPPAHPKSSTLTLPNDPSVNALLTAENNIYAATTDGLYLIDCNHPTQAHPLAKGCFNSLDNFDGRILAATTDAIFLIHPDSITQIARLPPTAYPHCVATITSTSFLAGCDDGTLRIYDIRQSVPREIPISNTTPRPFITAATPNSDKTFALVADTSNTITSIHLPTDSVAAIATTPFLPQALAFCDSQFYCGGSDSSTKALMRYDVRCISHGTAPVSVDSVYAFGLASSGALAVAGHCRNRKQLIDVYDNPPVRSFSLQV